MENGVAPRCSTAMSRMWNSGLLRTMRATVSPRETPRLARPVATSSTASRYSPQVYERLSPDAVRAVQWVRFAAVAWKASTRVVAEIPGAATGSGDVCVRFMGPVSITLREWEFTRVGQQVPRRRSAGRP